MSSRQQFLLPNVTPGTRVRLDTASGSTSPADVVDNLNQPVSGSLITADNTGRIASGDIYGPAGVTTLYLKTLDGSNNVTGTTTLTSSHPATSGSDPRVDTLIASAPGALDTLKELADALGDDASFAATVTTLLAGKENVVVHGSTASTARPTGATIVHWIGSVAPTNGVTNDEWTDTTVPVKKRYNGSAWVSLSGTSSTAAGVIGKGYAVPKGWGAKLKAAADQHATARTEWAWFGDSTTWGSGPTPPYSLIQRVRDKLTTDGYTYGGKGIFGGGEGGFAYTAPEVNGDRLISLGYTDVQDNSYSDILIGESFYSATANHQRDLQVYVGNAPGVARIWWTDRTNASKWQYQVDGGAWQTVTPTLPSAAVVKFVWITGLTVGTHTISVKNIGGTDVLPPTLATAAANDSAGSGPSMTAGNTYYYWVTALTAAGETTPLFLGNVTTVATRRVTAWWFDSAGQTGNRVYRGTVNDSTLAVQIGPDVTQSTASNWVVGTSSGPYHQWWDDGTLTAGSNHPPTTSTAGINTGNNKNYIAVAGMNATGIVVQKYARVGGLMGQYLSGFGASQNLGGGSYLAQAALGLVQQNPQPTTAPFDFGTLKDSTTGAASVSLAVLDLGFNDMTNLPAPWLSTTSYSSGNFVYYAGAFWTSLVNANSNNTPGADLTKWKPGNPQATIDNFKAGVAAFCELAKAAGADPLVVIPEVWLNANARNWGGAVVAAIRDTALACGAAVVDRLTPLEPPNPFTGLNSVGNPHLTLTGYQTIADFIYTNVIQPALQGKTQ